MTRKGRYGYEPRHATTPGVALTDAVLVLVAVTGLALLLLRARYEARCLARTGEL